MRKHIGILIFIIGFAGLQADLNVTEYVKLLTEKITACSSFKLPTNNSEETKTNSNSVKLYGNFDFIIVGGGAGGTLLARRLTEVHGWKILLLEAGGTEDDFTNVPALNYYLRNSSLNWGYFTKSQKNSCQGMVRQKCVYPTGKVLGGSCVLGDMVYARGNKYDFNRWAALTNDSGWNSTNVLPFMKITEQMQIAAFKNNYHGVTGLLKVNYTKPDPLNYAAFIKANQALGIKEADPNGANESSVSRLQWTVDFNKRQTGGNAFILPIVNNTPNLNLSLKSFTTKVLFEDSTAVGVEFVKGGIKYKATASKEVILSAGAINTPQLLMLSGVGLVSELTPLGIKVINNLPVGRHLKDHPVYLPLYIRTNTSAESLTIPEQVARYLRGENPLTSVFSASPVSFINTKNLSSDDPNLELIVINPPSSVPGDSLMFYNLDKDHQQMYSSFNTLTDHLIYVINLKPLSLGNVTLSSNQINDFPIIDPAYYSDPLSADIEVIYEGIQYVLRMLETPAMKAINATIAAKTPKCATLTDKAYWMCAIKHMTSTLYHPCCTARMGTSSNNSVIDSKMKVHNMSGLRVVDAAAMPDLVSGHPFAAIFMLAEKAAAFIKADYKES